jgi:serine/threonine-protein kinase
VSTLPGGRPSRICDSWVRVSVFAVDASGCAAPPETVPLEGGPFGVAVDPRTNTAYVSLIEASEVAGLHGSEPVGTIPGIPGPAGLDVDRRTRTLYVTNFAGTDAPGALSVVDIRACNGLDASGCEGPWPTTSTGRGPWAVLVDPLTHRVFTADFAHATVSVIDGASCNAFSQRGCARRGRQIPVGNIPLDLALDRKHHTLYVANAPDLNVSVINSLTPGR